jgi:hypothetical protein
MQGSRIITGYWCKAQDNLLKVDLNFRNSYCLSKTAVIGFNSAVHQLQFAADMALKAQDHETS